MFGIFNHSWFAACNLNDEIVEMFRPKIQISNKIKALSIFEKLWHYLSRFFTLSCQLSVDSCSFWSFSNGAVTMQPFMWTKFFHLPMSLFNQECSATPSLGPREPILPCVLASTRRKALRMSFGHLRVRWNRISRGVNLRWNAVIGSRSLLKRARTQARHFWCMFPRIAFLWLEKMQRHALFMAWQTVDLLPRRVPINLLPCAIGGDWQYRRRPRNTMRSSKLEWILGRPWPIPYDCEWGRNEHFGTEQSLYRSRDILRSDVLACILSITCTTFRSTCLGSGGTESSSKCVDWDWHETRQQDMQKWLLT